MKLKTGARRALQVGDEQLARRVLARKQFISDELNGLDQQVSELEAQQAQMVSSERAIRDKLERFRSQKEVTKARYSSEASLAVVKPQPACPHSLETSAWRPSVSRTRSRA